MPEDVSVDDRAFVDHDQLGTVRLRRTPATSVRRGRRGAGELHRRHPPSANVSAGRFRCTPPSVSRCDATAFEHQQPQRGDDHDGQPSAGPASATTPSGLREPSATALATLPREQHERRRRATQRRAGASAAGAVRRRRRRERRGSRAWRRRRRTLAPSSASAAPGRCRSTVGTSTIATGTATVARRNAAAITRNGFAWLACGGAPTRPSHASSTSRGRRARCRATPRRARRGATGPGHRRCSRSVLAGPSSGNHAWSARVRTARPASHPST